MSMIDALLPVAALYFAAQTAVVGPIEVVPEPKRIYGNVANYDGDTMTLRVDDGFVRLVFQARVLELDTPELRGACPEEKTKALQAKKATSDFLARGPLFLTKVDPALDQYGRILASVAAQSPSGRLDDLAAHLKADPRGIARDYDVSVGRLSWCPAAQAK
jgi:endonuclease YncB( thermonuclease family)